MFSLSNSYHLSLLSLFSQEETWERVVLAEKFHLDLMKRSLVLTRGYSQQSIKSYQETNNDENVYINGTVLNIFDKLNL